MGCRNPIHHRPLCRVVNRRSQSNRSSTLNLRLVRHTKLTKHLMAFKVYACVCMGIPSATDHGLHHRSFLEPSLRGHGFRGFHDSKHGYGIEGGATFYKASAFSVVHQESFSLRGALHDP